MLLIDFLKDIRDSLYAITREGKSLVKDEQWSGFNIEKAADGTYKITWKGHEIETGFKTNLKSRGWIEENLERLRNHGYGQDTKDEPMQWMSEGRKIEIAKLVLSVENEDTLSRNVTGGMTKAQATAILKRYGYDATKDYDELLIIREAIKAAERKGDTAKVEELKKKLEKVRRSIQGDSDVIININLGQEEIAEEIVEEEPEQPTSATEGTEYKGYTIKQEDSGVFTIFSVGGSRLTETDSLEHAMEIINGMAVDAKDSDLFKKPCPPYSKRIPFREFMQMQRHGPIETAQIIFETAEHSGEKLGVYRVHYYEHLYKKPENILVY